MRKEERRRESGRGEEEGHKPDDLNLESIILGSTLYTYKH